MLTVSAKIKDFFFDRLKVIAAVDAKRLKLLSNAGGYVRRTARNSMKAKGKARKPPKNMNGRAYAKWLDEVKQPPPSKPGSPPFTHTDDPVVTLKNILFAYNTANGGVVVGPVGLRHRGLRMAGGIIPPELHEYGGSTVIPEKKVTFPTGGHRWIPRGRRRPYPGQQTRNRKATYPARPYMAPAIAKTITQSRFKQLWFSNDTGNRRAG